MINLTIWHATLSLSKAARSLHSQILISQMNDTIDLARYPIKCRTESYWHNKVKTVSETWNVSLWCSWKIGNILQNWVWRQTEIFQNQFWEINHWLFYIKPGYCQAQSQLQLQLDWIGFILTMHNMGCSTSNMGCVTSNTGCGTSNIGCATGNMVCATDPGKYKK